MNGETVCRITLLSSRRGKMGRMVRAKPPAEVHTLHEMWKE